MSGLFWPTLLLRIGETDDLLVDESVMAELERKLQEFRDGKVTGIPAEKELPPIRETLKSQFVDIY
jgi:Putative addiction module component